MPASTRREITSYTSTVTLTHYAGALAAKFPDLPAKARAEAEQHRPPSDAVGLDHNEVELQSEAEKEIARQQQLFDHVLTETSRTAHELRQKLPELEGKIQQTVSDSSLQAEAATEMAEDRSTLVTATEERMRAEVDLRACRARHGITEQAVYPPSRIWHFALIAALALVETIINAAFYENAQGLLGGFIVALGVAGVNMSGALGMGMLFRYKNLSDQTKKIGGWTCLALFILFAVYCNALFAAFRAEYQLVADPSDAQLMRAAFSAALEQAGRVFMLRMKFGDFMSFILFGLGVILSSVAFYKGYTFDDKHPGHGKKDRAMKAAKQSELRTQDALRQRLKEFLQRKRRDFQSVSREPAEIMSAAGAKAAGLQHANTLFLSNQDAIQRDFSLLLRTYRNTNATIRATVAPAYFAVVPDLRVGVDAAAMDGVLTLLGQAHREAQELRDRFQESLSTKLNEVQRDSAVLLDATFASFVRSVEQEAEESINRTRITVQRASHSTQMTNA